jgi:hypothetical protein
MTLTSRAKGAAAEGRGAEPALRDRLALREGAVAVVLAADDLLEEGEEGDGGVAEGLAAQRVSRQKSAGPPAGFLVPLLWVELVIKRTSMGRAYVCLGHILPHACMRATERPPPWRRRAWS